MSSTSNIDSTGSSPRDFTPPKEPPTNRELSIARQALQGPSNPDPQEHSYCVLSTEQSNNTLERLKSEINTILINIQEFLPDAPSLNGGEDLDGLNAYLNTLRDLLALEAIKRLPAPNTNSPTPDELFARLAVFSANKDPLSTPESVNSITQTSNVTQYLQAAYDLDPGKYTNISDVLPFLTRIGEISDHIQHALAPSLPSSRRSSNPNQTSLSHEEPVVRQASNVSDTELKETAKQYRKQHKQFQRENSNIAIAEKPVTFVTQLLGKSPVVIIAEGDHSEFALDKILRAPNFAQSLKDAEVTTVIAEHLYPHHVESLYAVDNSEILKHLTQSLGSLAKAFNLVQFLVSCQQIGIKVIAADTPSIYQPSGVSMNSYNSTDRIENLNDNILKLYEEKKVKGPSGKTLILVGAAHSNSINASIRRREVEEKNDTPGLADVISEAEELVVIDEKKATKDSLTAQLRSIKSGYVIKVQ